MRPPSAAHGWSRPGWKVLHPAALSRRGGMHPQPWRVGCAVRGCVPGAGPAGEEKDQRFWKALRLASGRLENGGQATSGLPGAWCPGRFPVTEPAFERRRLNGDGGDEV
jgi:hypothetical protein